jgi:acetolactate synthase-1/2/3 large subunit
MRAMTTCGEVLVEILEAYGIDTVFGIPGVHTVELYRGLPKTKLRHVTPRHEQGAGFMADGYARVTGRPAACFIITGPGMTNIATALGQAYGDSVPMLVISSVNNSRELGLGEGRLHELPGQRGLIAGVTAFSHTLLRAENLPALLARAFAVFDSARPRPVHIELPLDVITASGEGLNRRPPPRCARPGPNPKAIAEAAALLSRARAPMVVLGGGTQDASEEARQLVETLGAPTALTINARGVLPPGHPLSLGGALPHPPVLQALKEADVVLAVGTELGETDTLLFDDQLKLEGKLIRIDIDPHQLMRSAQPEIAICSDAAAALAALQVALGGSGVGSEDGVARTAALRSEAEALLPEAYRLHQRLMSVLDAALPDSIVVGDSTQPVYAANYFYETRRPRSYFNSSTGYGTLGYALPAALGAKLAAPDRSVVALIGDGGIQFTLGELATAVELQLPVPILLWNNQGYGEIKRYMAERDIPQIGVDIYTPDFQTIAAGFGCGAAKAEGFSHLEELLRQAHNAAGPTLIEIDEAAAKGW